MNEREEAQRPLLAKIFHWEVKIQTNKNNPPSKQAQTLLCLFITCQIGAVNTKPMTYTGSLFWANGQVLTVYEHLICHTPKKAHYPLFYKVISPWKLLLESKATAEGETSQFQAREHEA